LENHPKERGWDSSAQTAMQEPTSVGYKIRKERKLPETCDDGQYDKIQSYSAIIAELYYFLR
jgi:hypothetical protein